MDSKHKILIVDDETKIRRILSAILTDEGFEVNLAENGNTALKKCNTFRPAIILMDQNMPGMNGIETMQKIREKYPQTVVIILTAYGEVSLAVDAIKNGAYDYIEKPFDNDKLLLLINRAFDHYKMQEEIFSLREKLRGENYSDKIIAVSNKMKQVMEQVKSVCQTDATVLIQGESGVGKELIANAIHKGSNRSNNPMVAINCGAIPLTLIESELFGHEKGSFTGANESKQGKFEQAHTGTLFLDELGELPLDAQVKLLRVLEERKITRLGGKKNIPVDVRIISATNNNLEEKVQHGEFRLDLLYRLNIFTIHIPPLRDRKEDIALLTDMFINTFNKQFKLVISSVSAEVMDTLKKYSWPGNIRDLQNAIQSAMILAKSGTITFEHLPVRVKGYEKNDSIEMNLENGLEQNIKLLNTQAEKELIIEALSKCNYNRTEAAKLLKISRKTLFNKMKMYNITYSAKL